MKRRWFTVDVFDCRTKIVSGSGAVRYLAELGARRLFLVTDPFFYKNGTAQTLFDAVFSNFEKQDALQRELTESTDRFGHSKEADDFAKELANELAEISRGIYNGRGIEWRTSLFTYYLFQHFGTQREATPDGRLAGQSYSRQMNMASPPVLTAAAQSMAVLTEVDFNDVGMFDFAIPAASTSPELTEPMTDYIGVCLDLKIPVLQTNTADRAMLIEERDHKGTHPDLVVRVCGYSAIFGQLPRTTQDEIISR
jgi:formate C-acetyltransferase